jgi:hypothetical protein
MKRPQVVEVDYEGGEATASQERLRSSEGRHIGWLRTKPLYTFIDTGTAHLLHPPRLGHLRGNGRRCDYGGWVAYLWRQRDW